MRIDQLAPLLAHHLAPCPTLLSLVQRAYIRLQHFHAPFQIRQAFHSSIGISWLGHNESQMEFVAQLKAAVDIVSVVGQYVRLKKVGQRYVGLCPFHSERTPSFNVHPAHQFYKCFGCGAGGDVIKFVMEIEGLTFWEAVRLLAERHGIPLPKSGLGPDPEGQHRNRLYELHAEAAAFFERNLWTPGAQRAREYLARRGIDEATAREFGLGYAPEGATDLVVYLTRRGYTQDELLAAGLALVRPGSPGLVDRFRGRLIYPIHNETGRVVAFAGRALDPEQEPKYLNSPETLIYHKTNLLYNLHRARQAIRREQRVILVEGYMDVIGLHQAGVMEVVASCGTALTAQQARLLHRHADMVIVNFDPDPAGVAATERSIQLLLEEGLYVRILELEDGLDPDEYVRAHGSDHYRRRLQGAPHYFHWLAQKVRTRPNAHTLQGRLTGFRELLLPALQRMPDRVARASVLHEIAEFLHVPLDVLAREMRRLDRAKSQNEPSASAPQLDPKEKLLVNLVLREPSVRAELLGRLEALEYARGWVTWPLLEKMIVLQRAQPEWGFSELEGRLDQATRALLERVALADEMIEPEHALAQARAFIDVLDRQQRRERIIALKRRIEEAERAGRCEEALLLVEELAKLEKGT